MVSFATFSRLGQTRVHALDIHRDDSSRTAVEHFSEGFVGKWVYDTQDKLLAPMAC